MIINDPDVIAELRVLYPRYEEALVKNDVQTLTQMFWDGPQVMRFGVTENLYGPAELEAFRKARPASNLARTIKRLDIVSFGRDFASVTLQFERRTADGIVLGRQSQTWVRMPEGWHRVGTCINIAQKLTSKPSTLPSAVPRSRHGTLHPGGRMTRRNAPKHGWPGSEM
jgi:hypothetical protein